MNQKVFSKGEVIFKQGELGDVMYEILSGNVGIYVNHGLPTEKKLTVLDEKKYLGELSVIDSQPHSATAVAEEKSILLEIIPSTLEEYLRENPTTAINILKNLSSRLRSLTLDYMDACHVIAEAAPILEAAKEKKPSLLNRLKKFVLIAEDDKAFWMNDLMRDEIYRHPHGGWNI